MSKQITLTTISNGMTENDVKSMIKMEAEQTSEWVALFNGMSYEQKNRYYELKDQVLKSKQQSEQNSLEDLRNDFLAFYHQGVARGSFSYTIEHFLEEVNPGLDLENVKLHYGYDAFKLVKCLREVRTNKEKFTFFWETESPFSQWHKSIFEGPSSLFINEEDRGKLLGHNRSAFEFSSAEQFMMYHKALLFLNNDVAEKILKETNARRIKELGRQVRNFDEDVWSYFRSKVVYEGNKAKFTQNNDLMEALADTKGTTLIEAAPNDRIWGIGLASDDPKAQKRETWEGKNLLGEILTLLRMEFMGMY